MMSSLNIYCFSYISPYASYIIKIEIKKYKHLLTYTDIFTILFSSLKEILVPSESVNVIAGDTVIFHCVVRAEELDWLVNKTRADEKTVIGKGFMQGGINDINETTRERTLTATGYTNYTNTNITCRAVNLVNDFGVMFSEPAVLLVQGNIITTQ